MTSLYVDLGDHADQLKLKLAEVDRIEDLGVELVLADLVDDLVETI